MKALVAIAASISLAAAPAVAAPKAAPVNPAPAAEQVEGSEYRGGILVPGIALIIIILAILYFTKKDKPVSP